MKRIIVLIAMLGMSLQHQAQSLSLEVNLGSRVVPSSQMHDDFRLETTASLGASLHYRFAQRWGIQAGLSGSFSHYQSHREELVTYYIDFYKKMELHYFAIRAVQSYTVELPVAISYDFLRLAKNRLALSLQLSPSINVYQKISGERFDEAVEIKGSPWTSMQHNGQGNVLRHSQFSKLNDIYISPGIQWRKDFDQFPSISLELGPSYGLISKQFGGHVRLGIQLFNRKPSPSTR